MIVLEFKAKGKTTQYAAIDEAIKTAQFVRNKCVRYWMDNRGVGQKELYRHNTALRAEYPNVRALNSHACQVAVERAYTSIAQFYDNCKKSVPGKKGYPRFKKNCRSVEYKTSGWSLSETRKQIVFTDKKGIGKLKLKGTWDLNFYKIDQIKRVRLVRRADGYYVQFLIRAENKVNIQPTGKSIGLDVGLKEFYTDSNGHTEPNPKFYRTGEKRLKFRQRRVSRKNIGSANRQKAINKLGRVHLKISGALTRTLRDWQREEHAKKVARCVIQSNDLVAYVSEAGRRLRRTDLRIKNLVKNHCLAKSINDAGWYQFRKWLEYFGVKFGRVTVAVNPAYTSQECSKCGNQVKKSLSMRTHACKCGFVLDRDWNAAINILNLALSTTGHVGTWIKDPNASGDSTSTLIGAILSEQVGSMNEESPHL
jgi:putative transposase